MTEYIPESINARGVITTTDTTGRRHLFHTDPAEAKAFALMTEWLSTGAQELGLILHANSSPAWLHRRQADGRTTNELKRDWLHKVTTAGMPEDAALQFFDTRIRLTD